MSRADVEAGPLATVMLRPSWYLCAASVALRHSAARMAMAGQRPGGAEAKHERRFAERNTGRISR